MPGLFEPPTVIKQLYSGDTKQSQEYLQNIRTYNNVISFASVSAVRDKHMSTPGPYFYKVNGQISHTISQSVTAEDTTPSHGHLYIIDTNEATECRMNMDSNKKCSPKVKRK